MADIRVVVDEAAIREMAESPDVVDGMGAEAERLRGRAGDVPRHLRLEVRKGVGPRSTYSQLVLVGQGAAAWEFGTRTHAPHGTLRRALGG